MTYIIRVIVFQIDPVRALRQFVDRNTCAVLQVVVNLLRRQTEQVHSLIIACLFQIGVPLFLRDRIHRQACSGIEHLPRIQILRSFIGRKKESVTAFLIDKFLHLRELFLGQLPCPLLRGILLRGGRDLRDLGACGQRNLRGSLRSLFTAFIFRQKQGTGDVSNASRSLFLRTTCQCDHSC